MSADYSGYSLEALAANMAVAELEAAHARDRLAAMQQELTKRSGFMAEARIKSGDKQHGETTFSINGIKLKGSISKTVSWDSDKLRAVASTLDWATVQTMFKIEMSVPEAVFNGITDESLRAAIAEARTVKYGALKITLAK